MICCNTIIKNVYNIFFSDESVVILIKQNMFKTNSVHIT